MAALSWSGGHAVAQVTEGEDGRRLAPPLPPARASVPPGTANRLTALPVPPVVTAPPALPPDRPTAPPMPPVVTLPLPTPCLFDIIFCPATHRYIIFGDSLARGFVALQGYADLYEDAIENDFDLELDSRNFGRLGLTSGGLARILTKNTLERQELFEADIVTWNIGGNDLRSARARFKEGRCGGADNQECLRLAVINFRTAWDQIVAAMLVARAQREMLVLGMDIYYPFVREDKAAGDFATLQLYWGAVNGYIADSLAAANISRAAVAGAFNGPDGRQDPVAAGYISGDGFHANDRGHQIIAQALRSVTPPLLPLVGR